MFHGSNLDGGPSVARLLGDAISGACTPPPTWLGERMVEAKVDEVYEANDNPTVQEILDNLMTIREYAQAPRASALSSGWAKRTATQERLWWILPAAWGRSWTS